MEEGTVGADSDALAGTVADGFPTSEHFRKAFSVLQIDEDHRVFTGADAVLLALGFVEDQECHSFFHLPFSLVGQDCSIFEIDSR